MNLDAEAIISKYIELRDFVKAEKIAFNAKMKPYTDAMEVLEGAAAKLMKETKQTSLHSDSGTCFPTYSESYKVVDPVAWHAWVRETQAWAMYTNSITPSVMSDYLDQTKDPQTGEYKPPPGITIEGSAGVQFRRA